MPAMTASFPLPASSEPTTAARLGAQLVADVVAHLEAFLDRVAVDGRLPAVYAGHRVGPDVAADLAFTLGFLHDAGVETIGGRAVPDVIAGVLRGIDGRATHTFYSYRVAETVGRFGPLAGNPLLSGWTETERANLAAACDSTDWIPLYDDGHLPRNYAAVLARCELGRQALGLEVDEAVLARLLDAATEMLARNPLGYLDDSNSAIGRYDIYTADVYLFTRLFADRLGTVWERGARAALDLVARVGATDGSGITWGRSTGALAACLTIELGALALEIADPDDHPSWLARAANAADRFADWMTDGLINAHQRRSTYAYRGLERRLQMTLDCLGKLAESAALLSAASEADVAASPLERAFADRDELVVFEPARNAAVWTYRSEDLAFVLPLVGPTISDYLPVPHNPGVFEVPVDSPLATGVPNVWSGLGRYVGGGLPKRVEHAQGRLVVDYDGFPVANEMERGDRSTPLAGTRRVEHRVEGRTVHVTDHLRFDQVPDAISVQLTESTGRRLHVTFDADGPHRVSTIDTTGIKEYRSFWSELGRVHQIDVDAAPDVTIRWSVTPMLRIGAHERDHHYMEAIYAPIDDRADIRAFPTGLIHRGDAVRARLDAIDTFHLHWPEWLTVPDVEIHRHFIAALRDADVRICWTQHNLEPHSKADLTDVYATWAAAADGVVHHSRWGMEQSRARYEFRDDAIHRVIPHVHWGAEIADDLAEIDRAEVEAELGLSACAIRLGVLGAPRAEKQTQSVIDAVHRCDRDDVGLFVAGLGDEDVPDDPRIQVLTYQMVPRRRYNEYLAVTDVVVLPYAERGMLTTGVVGDVVGAGKPAIVSPWPYLAEALGEAGITYDGTVDHLVDVIDQLDDAALERAAAASRALQPRCAREPIAQAHLDLFEALGLGLTRR